MAENDRGNGSSFDRNDLWRREVERRHEDHSRKIDELYELVRGDGSWADHRRSVTEGIEELKTILKGKDGRGGLVNDLTKITERMAARVLLIGTLPSVVAATIWLIYMWMQHPSSSIH